MQDAKIDSAPETGRRASPTLRVSRPRALPRLSRADAPNRDTSARRGKRDRATTRIDEARRQKPTLRLDRLGPLTKLLKAYREHPGRDAPERARLSSLLRELEAEVVELEAWAAVQGRRSHSDGASIRRALTLLRGYGRMLSLDFSSVPIEERDLLVAWLALEHRFCYAAAGTTRAVFKRAIGRTGAR